MTATKTQEQVRKINGTEYSLSELAELTGLTEQTVKATPNAALEGLVQAQEKAKKASRQNREKETPRTKFLKRGEGKMAEGIRHMVNEIKEKSWNKDSELSTTVQNMARRYGPVTLSVLYQDGHLSHELSKAIEDAYPESND